MFPLEDIRGIGRRYYDRFSAWGIKTAWDFYPTSRSLCSERNGIFGLRMHKELRGIPQYGLTEHNPKKGIATTRTFDKRTDKLDDLEERVSTFAFKYSEKLKHQNSCSRYLTFFIMKDRFKPDLKQYSNSITLSLPNPSNSAVELSKYAIKALKKIYLPYFQYMKAGGMVTEFVPDTQRMTSLFEEDNFERHEPLLQVMDYMNRRLGSDKIKLASIDIQKT